jgi:hypothetical protein
MFSTQVFYLLVQLFVVQVHQNSLVMFVSLVTHCYYFSAATMHLVNLSFYHLSVPSVCFPVCPRKQHFAEGFYLHKAQVFVQARFHLHRQEIQLIHCGHK